MSKYVRTKDGRILNFDKLNEVSKLSIDMAEEPIREADTIEELCEMFICGGDGFKMPSEMPLSNTEQYRKMKSLVKFGMIAGLDVWLKLGIWTKKGLIYVAKLNSKGEFELI